MQVYIAVWNLKNAAGETTGAGILGVFDTWEKASAELATFGKLCTDVVYTGSCYFTGNTKQGPVKVRVAVWPVK